MIYLDYLANTPADPAVLEAFYRTEQTYIGNPNSTHPAGQAAQTEMTRVTESIAGLLRVSPEEIIYTSGASESNNLALKGIVQVSRHIGRHVISTALEHSSVGGALFKRKDLVIEPQIHGGGSTTPYRSGTPALGLAVSTETALRLALENQEQRIAHVWKLNRFLRAGLSKYPAVRINSPENAVPHILNLSVSGVKGTVFQQELGKRGVCVSVKSACSVEGTPSKAVFAVNRDRKNALSSWRISLSHLTTMEEVREFLQIFDCCYKELVR